MALQTRLLGFKASDRILSFLLFGVFGGRWENSEFWKKIIEENDCKFIKPSEEEICKNSNTIENNCYW